MANKVISSVGIYTGYPAAISVDAANDYMLIQQSGAYKKITRNVLLGVTGTPADLSTVQVFTNKTIGNTNTVTLKDTLFTLQDDGDVTKQARFQLSGITTGQIRTYTLPNATGTLADLATAQTFTNKTLTAPIISGGTMDNTTITVDAIGEHTASNGVTVSGLNIKSGKLNTNNSVVTANVTDTAITPAKLQAGTGTGWAWSTWSSTLTNLTIGNGVVVSKYVQTGKSVDLILTITFGTTTVMGSTPTFSLPVTASSDFNTTFQPLGTVLIEDSGTTTYLGTIVFVNTTTAGIVAWGSAGTYVGGDVALTSAIPMTWATGDKIKATCRYEAA